MNRTIFVVTIFTSLIVRAQYFENFENGVPGTMIQKFEKGKTSFTDFGLATYQVETALAENNCAVFVNNMESNIITSSLQTPILDLTEHNVTLEFLYFQKFKTENYANILLIELSNDSGKSWKEVAIFKQTSREVDTIQIDMSKFALSAQSCIKFNCTQIDANKGNPIVIDNIKLKPNVLKKSINNSISEFQIYPNPSSGLFTIANAQNLTITIFDFYGKEILNFLAIETTTNIDLSSYPSGIYLAKVSGGEYLQTKKLIIN